MWNVEEIIKQNEARDAKVKANPKVDIRWVRMAANRLGRPIPSYYPSEMQIQCYEETIQAVSKMLVLALKSCS